MLTRALLTCEEAEHIQTAVGLKKLAILKADSSYRTDTRAS